MYKNIIEHGKDLKRVFNLDSSIDEVKLCKALFRIENKAHQLAEHFCSFYEDEEKQEKAILIIKKGLVDHTLVADPEINLAATMIQLQNI